MDRIAKLQELLLSNPEDSFVQHALALEHIKKGKDEEARVLFEKILSHDENYIGSYYHLARLLERNQHRQQAIKWYEKGMVIAKNTGDQHAFNELQAAYEDLIDE